MKTERDEHDPVELTGIEKAIDDCTAAVVTELDDGHHDELRASMRVLIDFAKQARKPRKHMSDCGCASCWSNNRDAPLEQKPEPIVLVSPLRRDITDAERALLADVRTIIVHAKARMSNGMTPEITYADVKRIEQLTDAFANALARL